MSRSRSTGTSQSAKYDNDRTYDTNIRSENRSRTNQPENNRSGKKATIRSYTANPEAAAQMKEIMPLCQKIQKRLAEDETIIMYPTTMIFFGALLFIAVFILTVYFFQQKKKLEKSGNGELDQGAGRGLNPPKVVPAADSAEGQAYVANEEKIQNERKEAMIIQQQAQPSYPSASIPPVITRYVDQYGRPVDITKMDNPTIHDFQDLTN